MRKLFTVLLAVVVLALAAFGVYMLFPQGESVADLGPFMQPIVEWTAAEAVEAVPRANVPDQLLVLPFPGDIRDRVQAAVVEAVEERGLARVVDPETFKEKAASESDWGSLVKDVLGLGPELPEKAREFLKRHALPGVLLGEAGVKETESDGSVSLRLRIYDTAGATIYDGTVKRVYKKSLFSWAYLRSRILGVSLAWRLLGWLLFLIVLPLVLSPLLMRRLKRESNVANGITLAGLTLVTAFALWLALALSSSLWAALWIGVLGVGVGGVYHYLILDFFEELRQ
jgi:hypothetical protein